MGSDRCPFCVRIARGGDPRHGKDQLTASFEPLNPVTRGHRLFVPTAHYEHSPQALGRAVEAAQRYGLAHYKDFHLVLNQGANATQTVPHLHVHLVPRRPNDGLVMPWTGQCRACGWVPTSDEPHLTHRRKDPPWFT